MSNKTTVHRNGQG